MKWYNYKDEWVNIDLCFNIYIGKRKLIFYNNGESVECNYETNEERDAEFAKIKILMGVVDFTSRCC